MIERFQLIDYETPITWGIDVNLELRIATYTRNNFPVSSKEIPNIYKEVLNKMVIKGSSLVGVPLPT